MAQGFEKGRRFANRRGAEEQRSGARRPTSRNAPRLCGECSPVRGLLRIVHEHRAELPWAFGPAARVVSVPGRAIAFSRVPAGRASV